MNRLPMIFAFVLGTVVLLLVIFNSQKVEVNLLVRRFHIPMSILLVGAVTLGFVLGLVLPLLRTGKHKPSDQ